MLVKFAINVGTRDADRLGLDHAACLKGKTLEVTEDQADAIRAVCGPASILGIGSQESVSPAVEPKPAKPAKAEPTDAELDKLTDPKKK